uniref:RNase NYN domain-containing protein n=1 Tax=Loa loa TaxID=7209 RepID=A0A1I7VY51_LOALO
MPVEVEVDVSTDVTTANTSKHSYLRQISGGVTVPVVQDNFLERYQLVSSKGRTSGNMVESHDSCYSSCSEESHSSLSRESSDSIAKKIEQISVARRELNAVDTGIEQQYLSKHRFLQNIDFATRLGYSMEQLETVLGKLGMSARQDQILDELIKFGPGMMDRGLKMVETRSPNTLTTELRSIVIDGSNIAITHGRKEIFSCRGIRECVQFFRNRGHTDIIVFVPQFRRESARSDCPITDQYILFELEKENVVVWTPSRRINGRRIVCHDDRYILKTAEEKDAVIVSNDEYRDLIKENPQYRTLVDERLLMYSFVDGRFMPPDDPLGRHGPRLAEFLTKGNRQSQSQVCPYARRCTYGNKCKIPQPFPDDTSQPIAIPHELMDHPAVTPTQSLNISASKKMTTYDDDKRQMRDSMNYYQKEATQLLSPLPPSQLSVSSFQQTTAPFLQNLPLLLSWTHQIRDQDCSALSNDSPKVANPKPFLPLPPIIRRNSSATNLAHYCYSSTTIPPAYQPYPYISLPYRNGNSTAIPPAYQPYPYIRKKQ